MISAVAWIPRGVAKSVPIETGFTEEELAAAKVAAEGAACLEKLKKTPYNGLSHQQSEVRSPEITP